MAGQITAIRAAGAKAVSDLGTLVDRIQDHLVSQLNPALKQIGALATGLNWTVVGSQGAPSLMNGWVYFGGASNRQAWNQPRFAKDGAGNVHLSGIVKSGSVGFGLSNAIFVLPSGFLPLGPIIVPCVSNDLFGEIRIGSYTTTSQGLAGGDVTCVVGSNAFVSLDGICFPAER